MFLIFDTETTGLPRDWNAPLSDLENWPRAVQIAWQLHDELGNLVEAKDFLIQPEGFDIPFDAERIHGISTQLASDNGTSLDEVLNAFEMVLTRTKFVVGQNLKFDLNIMGAEFLRSKRQNILEPFPVLDTCTETTANLCKIPGGKGGRFKLPTLTELHLHLFGTNFEEAHNATADVESTSRCFFELIRREVFTAEELEVEKSFFTKFKEANPEIIQAYGIQHINLKEASNLLKTEQSSSFETIDTSQAKERLKDVAFAHLHNYSQFTVLQSTMSVKTLVKLARKNKMPAVALTDIGNMMGAFQFEKAVTSLNKEIDAARKEAEEKGELFTERNIIPIIGCELNVCKNHLDKTTKDNGYQIVFLAKNKNGYQNLIKLASIAQTEGKYYVPRIDKTIVEKYHQDLIVLSGSLYGEVSNLILNVGEKQAEEAIIWWKDLLGEDFYLEIVRHGQEDENRVNETLIRLANKHQVKLIATNNTHYSSKEEAETHDVLLCVRDSEQVSTPIGRGRNFRFGLENNQYYFKSSDEMKELFLDVPEAIENIAEVIHKIEPYRLTRDVLLPEFDTPEEFKNEQDKIDNGKRGENAYLAHLTFEGAKKRYSEITPEIQSRLEFELQTIERTGYPGYFLIVQDFCRAAREMGVSVGPGRGSAAGSAVAYCIGITNVDPIKYDLLFERFLNPDRVSLPDIDIDFDDEGRGKVIDWVINKYGANQVAQIITYGTMAAKSSIRDAGRVMNLPLLETNAMAKLVPSSISLNDLLTLKEDELVEKLDGNTQDLQCANELRAIAKGNDMRSKVLNQALHLEGSIRNTGIHACGVIITPEDITHIVPVALAKDSKMWCTQFDNYVVEDAGLLKMDFLGLKTLTLIKDAVKNIEKRHNIKLDPDTFPIDDIKTYELFQRGETVGVFQYESPGMQKYLRELIPTVFGDLIAMNALFRPGPMEYIPDFVKRKNGEQAITYDLDACEEFLKETYGITVYQEQVMLLSQKLAGFTKGEADSLRKAMGKKNRSILDEMKPKFISQGNEKGHDPEILEKIWKDWEAFASYAFNKSHSTCYAWVAYQTAYLKANYPAEYMAAVLSNNTNDITQVTFFMEECRRMGIEVLGPDVNESAFEFTVNSTGAIRFGLGGIKGLGSGPVENIIAERENGIFHSIFEMTKRLNLRLVNKKSMESMVYAGCFDSFKGVNRAQYFTLDASGKTFIENALKFGNSFQESEDSAQVNMFGESTGVKMPEPQVPESEDWSLFYKLNREKEVVGIFISAHPLDDYKVEISTFCNATLEVLADPDEHKGKEVTIPAIITDAQHLISKTGNQYGVLQLEDYTSNQKIFVFGDAYLKNKHMLTKDLFVAIRGKFQESKYPDKITKQKKIEFTISKIEQLGEMLQTRSATMNINISLKSLDQLVLNKMDELFSASESGNCLVRFIVSDELDNISVSLPSKRLRITPTSNLLDEFVKMKLGISFDKPKD